MKTAKNVHIVAHMHWDREWYFTTEESKILLVNNMEEIMQMLEQNDNYPYYVLDGQTAVLEDYFSVKPENKKRVKKLVEQGKLIIGPWYTQTDEMVVGGESIVRNLLYGLKDCREFGDPMMIGYLPDSFGQSEKLPQILNGFGINRCIFWRGVSERFGTNKNNFHWKSMSEGEVLVHLMPLGYAIGKYLPEDEDGLKKRMDKYFPVLDRGAINEEILLPNGHDQMPVQRNIFTVMEKLKKLYPEREFFLSRYENIFDITEKEQNIDTIQGELLDGKYMRVHRSIFSTRADLKSSNTRIENKITNILEPLMSIAYSLGCSYEAGFIELIWKDIMKNHAHDSIGCCCSDIVHKDVENRFFAAEMKTDELIRFYKRKIVDAMSVEKCLDKFTAFNLLPYDRSVVVEGDIITKMKNFSLVDADGNKAKFEVTAKEIVDAGLIDRQIVHYGNYDPFVKYSICLHDTIPSMGFKTYLVIEELGEVAVATSSNNTENEYYNITINKNGSLTILDKKTNTTYNNVLLIEDGADDGDEYDYSPLEDDFIVTSENVVATSEVKSFENKTEINIAYSMDIPKDLDSRKAKVVDSIMGVVFSITLKKGSPILEVKVSFDNASLDHRVRVLIPNNISAKFSQSDNQFGMIKRPVYDSAMDVWESEDWDERPDSIYPMLSYVALDNNEGLGVLTNSVREYEIIGESYDTIAITLFRGVGFLGKEEMYRRPGRPSGIKLPTPDSQMLGKQSFDIAIASQNGNMAKLAKEYTTQVVVYNKMPFNAMKLNDPSFSAPYNYSLLKSSNDAFVLSTLKKAEDRSGFVLRGYQTCEDMLETNIDVVGSSVSSEVNLAESDVKPMGKGDTLKLPCNVVKSYYIDK